MQSRLSTARARMLRRLYDRIIALSSHPHALAWLFLLAVAESSVFPLAPDILIIPMAIARPRQAWLIALVAWMYGGIGLTMPFVILGAFFGFFFRDPHRSPPADLCLIVSPADGRVLVAGAALPVQLPKEIGSRSASSCRSWTCTSIACRHPGSSRRCCTARDDS